MSNITIGRYDGCSQTTPDGVESPLTDTWSGWVEGEANDGTSWIFYLDGNGRPAVYWPTGSRPAPWSASRCSCSNQRSGPAWCLDAPPGRPCASTSASSSGVPAMPAVENEPLRRELTSLLNRYSMENRSNVPDFILADYLLRCLDAFDTAVNERSSWYGRHDEPGQALAGTA